jgi:hypothetical protein
MYKNKTQKNYLNLQNHIYKINMEQLEAQFDKFPNQKGTIDTMLNLDPRMLTIGIIYKCTTNNKMYIIDHKTGGIKCNVISDVRKGNFIWSEIVYSQEQNGYIRGTDTMTHVKTGVYPDSEVKDVNDLLVVLSHKLDVNSVDQKLFYKRILTGQVDVISEIEKFINPIVFSQDFKNAQNKNWINELLPGLFESVFFNWIQM